MVFRGSGEQRRVLVEHRPHYNDWTLPKGKPHGDEQLPVTAVREVEEETGIHVRLGLPLPSLRYDVSAGPKQVHFWLATRTAPSIHIAMTRPIGSPGRCCPRPPSC
ncbi:NUDIX domain-containing protein [Propionibacterium freudenreichii]|nr:NUDIX domain-containing protein [Propionibacterium freudenreichii]